MPDRQPDLEAVHAELGTGELVSLVDRSFLDEYGLLAPQQYGMVSADVGAAVERLEALGTGPYLHGTIPAPGWVERGQRRKVSTELALGYCNAEQIEILGAGRNTDFYREAIPADGSLALHHVGIFQSGLDELSQRLGAGGYNTVVSGGIHLGFYSTRFAYFDTRADLGIYLEVVEFKLFGQHTPPTRSLIETVAKIATSLAQR